jgi:hypothetical protein
MKNTIAGLILLTVVAHSHAQVFDLSWNTVDAGGGLLISASYELSGTIGQPDAGSFSAPLTGGSFELVGGFWPVAAAPPSNPGDVDGDGDVDLEDLTRLLSAFGTCTGDPAYVPEADFDRTGCVELADLTTLLARFGL